MTRKNILIIFSRYPRAGSSKTRLIPAIGPENAAALQRRMTEEAIGKVKDLSLRLAIEVMVFFTGGSEAEMIDWLGPHDFRQQTAGDLGQRMSGAFEEAFAASGDRVVVIGTDCPGLNADILHQAFSDLSGNDLVLGPALDGGYYLMGLRRETPFLFDDMAWGSSDVLAETLRRADRDKMTVLQLTTLSDIDRPEDLAGYYEV